MTVTENVFPRNLFEIENARNLSREDIVRTFVPPQAFWRLLSAKHHILLGSRGSGKTAIAKMLSHDHLSLWREPRAQIAISTKAFIGIYLPTRLEWVGGLRNKPWQTEPEKEEYFAWRLNIASCLAFLNTMESCLAVYAKDEGLRARSERDLCMRLSRLWSENLHKFTTISDLREYVEDVEYQRQLQLARFRAMGYLEKNERPVGLAFQVDLFAPLRRAISIASHIFGFSETTAWLLCLDEAEFLDDDHQRILNSHMRAHSGNLFFKIATMPYAQLASETTTRVSLDPGHDFDYVYLDSDRVFHQRTRDERGRIGTWFARTVFNKRAEASDPKYSSAWITDILGNSELLDPKPDDWTPGSRNMALLERYASAETWKRAKRLAGHDRFMDEIGRKIHGALLLRAKTAAARGRGELDAYSGATMAMRCGDGNPRRLIRIFNAMFLAAKWTHIQDVPRPLRLYRKSQNRVLLMFSSQTLASVQSEQKCGERLHRLITEIGLYMRHCLYDMPLTTDQVSSITIESAISDDDWKLIQKAVALGLLYPNINPKNPDELPSREGTFHLAYALAPYFRLLPRRGKARSLKTVRRFAQSGQDVEEAIVSHVDSKQAMLF